MNSPLVRWFNILALSLALGTAITSAQPENQLTRLHENFMERYDEINRQLAEAETSLADGYLKALNRLREKIQTSGIIEKVLPVRDEITAIQNRVSPLPELPAAAPTELKQLRETYQKSLNAARKKHAAALVPLADKMIQLVNTESETLTKAGKLDEALVARHMAKTLEENQTILDARALIAPTPGTATGTWQNLAKLPFTINSSGPIYCGPVIGEGGKGNLDPNIAGWANRIDNKSKEVFLTSPGAKITFQLDKFASQIKGNIAAYHPKAAYTLRVFADKRLAGEIKISGTTQSQPFEFPLTPADRVVFEIIDHDQSPELDFGLIRLLKFR
jgi:hypothetical protein